MNRTFLAALAVCICSSALHADLYTENYDRRPGEDDPDAGDFAAIVGSPFGVVYDFYENRAGRRFVEEKHYGMVVGTMDEAFYWGHNDQLYGPGGWSCCRAAGDFYCDADNTGYLINGYGTGYPTYLSTGEETDFLLGMTFMDPSLTGYRDTQVYSVKFGYAGGSISPSAGVTIRGMKWDGVGFVAVWSYSTDITYSPTALSEVVIPADAAPVNRIEIDRLVCPIWCPYHGHRDSYGAWYILDDLTFDVSNWGNPTPSGGYEWAYYPQADYNGTTYIIPAPGAVVLGMAGLGLVGWLKRKGVV